MIKENAFGKKAVFKRPNHVAVCFQCINGDDGSFSLNIDMAKNPNNIPTWSNKSTIQLSIDELFMLVSFFLKFEDTGKFSFHGINKNKSVLFTRNQKESEEKTETIIIKQMDAGKDVGYFYLSKMEGFRVYKLAMMQLCKYYNQTEREILFSIRQFLGHN